MPSTTNLAKKKFTFGTCGFAKTSPRREELTSETRALNIVVPFEDALKLNLAIDECVRELNSYNRSFKAGKDAALNLTLYLDKGRITVNLGKI